MEGVSDRRGLEVLDTHEALELAASVPVGRVAFAQDGEIFVTPVNHRVHGRSIVFRTGRGSTFGAAWDERPATFEVDAFDAETRTGWSVVVRGIAMVMEDPDEIESLDLHPWVAAADDETSWIRVLPNSVLGRRIVREELAEAPTA